MKSKPDVAILLMRIGLGAMMMVHGVPKLLGGIEKWTALGGSMKMFGITFAPVFWGFMASFAEGMGGLLVILGIFFRPACTLLFVTMLVAAASHISRGDGIMGASHAIETGVAFLGLFLLGPGKYKSGKW
jgi:putative oxidoreductase